MHFWTIIATTAIVAALCNTGLCGEGGTGLQGPEPGTIALVGAAVLFGVPAYFWRRRKQRAEAQDEAE